MRLRPLPSLLIQVVNAALQVCDRTEYTIDGPCRACGGSLSGYDTRMKRFAVLCSDEGVRPVEIVCHRSSCRVCGRVWMPEVPFYPDTRAGSPVVDLCRTLATTMSCGQVARRLEQMGVKVDRWSVQAYVRLPLPVPPMVSAFGMNLPLSIVSLSTLGGSQGEGSRMSGEDVLAVCYYPSRQHLQPSRSD